MANVNPTTEEMSDAEVRQAAEQARGLRVDDRDTSNDRTRVETFGDDGGNGA